MKNLVHIIGAGLAGSEAALQLADRGIEVALFELRPNDDCEIHKTGLCAELVCSNSLKSTKPTSAAGMLKSELEALGSRLYRKAVEHRVPAGGALAVERDAFSQAVTDEISSHKNIHVHHAAVAGVNDDGSLDLEAGASAEAQMAARQCADAIIVATGPLTSARLLDWLIARTGQDNLAFFDAAAPIVMADSLDMDLIFRQSRYEEGEGDYLNAPFTKEEYDRFIDQLIAADRVIAKDFETSDLFQACQPIEEIARKGHDAPRFGPLKPVGLTDPRTQRRPWAALQLRAEDPHAQSFNLVGFQTNLTFGEQKRVLGLIPGLAHAEFARYGVMHKNAFINAPACLDATQRLHKGTSHMKAPLYLAGQITGTEGYVEAIRSGLNAALSVAAHLRQIPAIPIPKETAYGSLLAYATNPDTCDYQPMHVNFGIIEPLDKKIKNKSLRYEAYAKRGNDQLVAYKDALRASHLLGNEG